MLTYNERSWAMDLASAGNNWLGENGGLFSRISGETGLRVGASTLFPDLLLHTEGDRIILGIELKFPDTNADDSELLENATKKAASLNLNHTLTWNVNDAILWEIGASGPVRVRSWNLTNSVSRQNVFPVRQDSFNLFTQILNELDQYFRDGEFRANLLIDALLGDIIVRFVELNAPVIAERIERSCNTSTNQRALLLRWWHSNSGSWPKILGMYMSKAKTVLFAWSCRLIVSHLLCAEPAHRDLLKELENLDADWNEYKRFFGKMGKISSLTELFGTADFDMIVGNVALQDFHALNMRLCEAVRNDIDKITTSYIYNRIMSRGLRKSIGQFITPPPLARLLLAQSMPNNRTEEIMFIDPCCGSATFPYNAVMMADGKFPLKAYATDKFRLPTMLSLLRLLPYKTSNVDVVEADIFQFGQRVTLKGMLGNLELDTSMKFDWICFNPPFVRQEDVELALQPHASKSSVNPNLVKRTDLSGYIILQAADMLNDGGRMGFIAPNSILNTVWGEIFLSELRKKVRIDTITRSVDEKWFSYLDDDEPAEVISVAVSVTKRDFTEASDDEITEFVTQTLSLGEIDSQISNEELIDAVIMSSEQIENPVLSSHHLSWSDVERLRTVGVGINSMFEQELDSLLPLLQSLRPITDILAVTRGERRGWNPLFYPDINDNNIEAEYIRPLIRTSKEISSLIALPKSIAFCCSASKEQLQRMEHNGALEWIEKFENARNGKAVLLPEALTRSGLKWYEIAESSMTDFVMMMNPDQRHLVARCPEPAIVDQRLIRVNLNPSLDSHDERAKSFLHAILNSSLSYLYFELIGFGRGLGALDLNPTMIGKKFHILDPLGITEEQMDAVIEAFKPLLARPVLSVEEEIRQTDRIHFEESLLSLYGFEDKADEVRSLLFSMASNRKTVARR